MRYIIVEDNYKAIKGLFSESETDFVTGQNLFKIVEKFKSFTLDKYDIIVINCESVFSINDKPNDFKGIQLLKWLRVHLKICNRVIMTSFLTREFLLQNNPKDYILFAPSNYFLQLPFNSIELNNIKINSSAIKNETFLNNYYKAFVSPDFQISDISHSFSNEFGLHLLSNLSQQLFFNNEESEEEIIQEQLLSFSKAKLLYDLNIDSFDSVDKIIKERDKVSKALQNKKVVYIDDQGQEGWFTLMRGLLGVNNKKLVGIKPKESSKNSIDFLSTIDKIKKEKPEILFLDLRLLGDFEKDKSIEETSGAILLKLIRKWNPAIPVILTSATDRVRSLDVLSKTPYIIDAIWTKPRVDKKGFNTSKSVLELYSKVQFLCKLSNDKIGLTFKEIDYRVENDRVRNSLLPKINESFINQYDYVLFDANYFCDTYGNIKDNVLYIHAVLKQKNQNTKVVAIDDVINEVYLNSYKFKSDKNLSRISRYSSKLLSALINVNEITNLYDIVNDAVKKELSVDYESVRNNPTKQTIFHFLKIKQFVVDSQEIAEKLKERLNKEIKKNQGIVHADNVFKHLIINLINKNNNVLFISNDINCKKDIALYNNYREHIDEVFNVDYKKDEDGKYLKDKNENKIKTSSFAHNQNFKLNKKCRLISNLEFVNQLKNLGNKF